MRAHPVVWSFRVCWLLLPFTAGEAISAAVDHRSTAVAVATAMLAWTLWAAVLVAALVPHHVTLTIVRVITPVAPLATATALTVGAPAELETSTLVLGAIGLAAAILATAAAWSGALADEYVNAASYGDERRFALRVPVAFKLGPVPAFWAVMMSGLIVGPILLAARSWIAGTVLLAAGLVVANVAIRSFHALSRRWLVFVPAGATLVDHLVLVDPVMFPVRRIARLAPALDGTSARDLTSGASGLILEIAFDAPVEIVARTARAEGETELVGTVLVSPVRPGAVVTEAARRRLPTGATT